METVGHDIKQKTSNKYCCEICYYITDRKSNLENHLLTAKHKMATNGNSSQHKISNGFHCEKCDKKYKDRTGLWKHKQKCASNNDIENDINKISPESLDKDQLIIMLLKQNAELIKGQQDMFMKVVENGTHNNNHNTTNSHNKSFNLQFFLNETCKDAMNIMDFVDSIKIQLSDLENVGKLGYVDGISNIIAKNLNSLDETKRPVHCTDTKREVMYVKDEDKWEKEEDNKPKIRKLIKHVAHKNTKLLKDYKTKYPGCEKSESKYSDKYDKLIVEAFGGKGDNDDVKEDKIIKNILKGVKIEKDNTV
jgi:hypothetical protein